MGGLRLLVAIALAAAGAACSTSTESDVDASMSIPKLDESNLKYTNPAPPKPVEMDPSRKISEQDCSKAVDLEHGNLLCK